MSVLFVDGMDYCDLLHWAGHVSPFTPSAKYISYNRINVSIEAGLRIAGSSGAGIGNCVRLNNSGFGNQTYSKILGVGTSFCAGFALNMADPTIIFRYEAGGATVPGPGGGNNTSTSLFLELVGPQNAFRVYSGPQGISSIPGTLLWDSTGSYALPLHTSVYVELQVDTSTGTWAIYVNDVLLQQQTGVSIPAGIDRFSLLTEGFTVHSIDDLYITDGERLGPCRVTGFAPNFGSTHQWSPLVAPNLSQIHEFGNRPDPLQTPDDNTSYVSASVVGTTDYYGFPAPACYGRILALALNVDGSAISGSPSVDFLIKIEATEYAAGFSDAYIGGYGIRQGISLLNPQTGTFWTDAEIAAALFGFRFAGSGELRVTQFMLEKLVSLRAVPYSCGGGAISYTS